MQYILQIWHLFMQISNRHLGSTCLADQADLTEAQGYRRYNTIKAIIYLLTGKLDFSNINQHHIGHSTQSDKE